MDFFVIGDISRPVPLQPSHRLGRGQVEMIVHHFLHLRDRTLTWLGVGNVEAVLFHRARLSDMTRHRALLRAGVIGYRLPPLHAEILPLKPFDTLIIATDGIKPDFDEGLTLDGAPEHIADGILARHRSGMDDALVVVARYLGGDRERSPA